MLFIKRLILNILGLFSKRGKLPLVVSYIHCRRHIPNFHKPRDIAVIWIKYVVDGNVEKNYLLADKYAVRNYVEGKGLSNILTPLIGVYDKPSEIDFEKLPSKFALKMNFGCGMNIICRSKDSFNISLSKMLLEKWLNVKQNGLEAHYNKIERKILCESYIDDGSGHFPTDYKFICIKGKVFCILACSERDSLHSNYLPYDLEWKPLYQYRNNLKYSHVIKRPDNLEAMITIAQKLSENIDLVRVDLYSNGQKVWFGEMTLTPSGCVFHGWTDKAVVDMAEFYKKQE